MPGSVSGSVQCRPGYGLTDGFPVRGLAVPALAMWKGDEVAACVAAASVVAKVTRDQIMRDLHKEYPQYGFSRHKGYSTPSHMRALADHGPCPQHRVSFANVHGLADGCLAEPGSSFDDAVAGPGRDGAGSAAVDSARDVARHAMSRQLMGGGLTYG